MPFFNRSEKEIEFTPTLIKNTADSLQMTHLAKLKITFLLSNTTQNNVSNKFSTSEPLKHPLNNKETPSRQPIKIISPFKVDKNKDLIDAPCKRITYKGKRRRMKKRWRRTRGGHSGMRRRFVLGLQLVIHSTSKWCLYQDSWNQTILSFRLLYDIIIFYIVC